MDDGDYDNEAALLGEASMPADDPATHLPPARRGHALVVALAGAYVMIAATPIVVRQGGAFVSLALPIANDGPLYSVLNGAQLLAESLTLPLICAQAGIVPQTRTRSIASLLAFLAAFNALRGLLLARHEGQCHFESDFEAATFLLSKICAMLALLLVIHFVVPIAYAAYADCMLQCCPAAPTKGGRKRSVKRILASVLLPTALLGLLVRHTGFVQRHLRYPPSCPSASDISFFYIFDPHASGRDLIELILLVGALTSLLLCLPSSASPATPAEDAQYAGLPALILHSAVWPLYQQVFFVADAAASLLAIGVLPKPSEYEPNRTPDDPLVEWVRLLHFAVALCLVTMHSLIVARYLVDSLAQGGLYALAKATALAAIGYAVLYGLGHGVFLSLLAERVVMGDDAMRTSFCEMANPRNCGEVLVWLFPWAIDLLA